MKTFRTLMLGAVPAGLSSTGSAQTWLTNGLVAYYPFNGNVNDESGNSLCRRLRNPASRRCGVAL